jgi:hypothetical protein
MPFPCSSFLERNTNEDTARTIVTQVSFCYIKFMNTSEYLLLRIIIVLIATHVCSGNTVAQKKFLFDATKAETAGNADWVIDEDTNTPGRFPTPPESTITPTSPESYWMGALSSWGIALVKMGHHVETLPAATPISYGNSSNSQDLKNYDVYIVDEPNVPFTAAEKTAIMQFVENGGGLFMISDHAGADRNNDGWDAVRIWNDLMRNNSIRSLPFGMLLDSTNYSETTTNILTDTTNPILNGPAGPVTQLKFSNGATITLNPSTNSTARGIIWRSSLPQTLTNVMVATASFGSGKVCLVGDSSPADDGTGASGNSLFPGWTEVGVSHANLHLNGSLWLSKKDTTLTYTNILHENPLSFALAQNYPNPFNPTTTIGFELPEGARTKLSIYDVLGREVTSIVDENLSSGFYHYTFDGVGLSSGIYFCRLSAVSSSGGNEHIFTGVEKMLLLR